MIKLIHLLSFILLALKLPAQSEIELRAIRLFNKCRSTIPTKLEQIFN